MTEISNLSPGDVTRTLSTISKEIDETTAELADLDLAAVKARAALGKAHAKAFLSAEGSMDIRKYTAELEVADLKFAAEVADQELRACNGRLKALRDRLEVGRSIGALVRLEWVS